MLLQSPYFLNTYTYVYYLSTSETIDFLKGYDKYFNLSVISRILMIEKIFSIIQLFIGLEINIIFKLEYVQCITFV